MIEFGCPAHNDYPLAQSASFAQENGFTLLQVWYDRAGIALKKEKDPVSALKACPVPCIIHAVLEIGEIIPEIKKLLPLLEDWGHHQLILHPVHSGGFTPDTFPGLIEAVKKAQSLLASKGIALHVENNSPKTPLLWTPEEVGCLFEAVPEAHFLLDIAHIAGYEALEGLIEARKPAMLHLADKHFSVLHEHLPIGEGELDFRRIFSSLSGFSGPIILEITQSPESLVQSREKLSRILSSSV